ncbi:MAG TPA: hypothetical protein GX507_02130 [Clostridia bacterium]|nr:hypothetical protein [Clostridia bacterium]
MKRITPNGSNDPRGLDGPENRSESQKRLGSRAVGPSAGVLGESRVRGTSLSPKGSEGQGSEMGRGVALSFDGKYAVVLTPDGGFERAVPLLAGDVAKVAGGEDIVGREIYYRRAPEPGARTALYPSLYPRILTGLRVACAVATVLLFLAMGVFRLWGPLAPGRAYAYVYVDINPSVEMLIDAKGKVIRVRACDSETAALVARLGGVRGKNVEEVTRAVVEAAVDLGAIKPASVKEGGIDTRVGVESVRDRAGPENVQSQREETDLREGKIRAEDHPYKQLIMITISPRDIADADEGMEDLKDRVAALKNAAEDELRSRMDLSEVVVIAALLPQEVRESALDAGIPPGRYALWLEAADQGIEVRAQDMARGSMTEALKKAGGDPEKIARGVATNPDLGALLRRVKEKKAQVPTGKENEGQHRKITPHAPGNGEVAVPADKGPSDKTPSFAGQNEGGKEDDSKEGTPSKEKEKYKKREEKPGGKGTGAGPKPASGVKTPMPVRTPVKIGEDDGNGDDDAIDDDEATDGNRARAGGDAMDDDTAHDEGEEKDDGKEVELERARVQNGTAQDEWLHEDEPEDDEGS